MKVSLEIIKKVLDQFSNTVFPDEATRITVPVLGNFNDLDYSNEIKTTKFTFEKDGEEWFLVYIE